MDIDRRKRAVFGWNLILDENIVVIDTIDTTYFENKSDFQYKIIVVRGRDIHLSRHSCRGVL